MSRSLRNRLLVIESAQLLLAAIFSRCHFGVSRCLRAPRRREILIIGNHLVGVEALAAAASVPKPRKPPLGIFLPGGCEGCFIFYVNREPLGTSKSKLLYRKLV
jgi:hypothetical protein